MYEPADWVIVSLHYNRSVSDQLRVSFIKWCSLHCRRGLMVDSNILYYCRRRCGRRSLVKVRGLLQIQNFWDPHIFAADARGDFEQTIVDKAEICGGILTLACVKAKVQHSNSNLIKNRIQLLCTSMQVLQQI